MAILALLPRAANWLEAISAEFKKRDRLIELDTETTKVTLELIIGKRSGNPVKIKYHTSAECDLTESVR